MNGFTHHARQRINERGNNVIHANNKSLYKNIKKKGVSAYEYVHKVKNTPLAKYLNFKLKSNKGKCLLMLYQNYIFVMSVNKSTIVTTYPLPECFIGEFRDYVACGNINNYVQKEDAKYLVKLWNKQHQPITTDKYFNTITDANNYVILRMQVENCTKDYYSTRQINAKENNISFFRYCIEKGFAEVIELSSLNKGEILNVSNEENYYNKFEMCNVCNKSIMECISSGQCKVSIKK